MLTLTPDYLFTQAELVLMVGLATLEDNEGGLITREFGKQ